MSLSLSHPPGSEMAMDSLFTADDRLRDSQWSASTQLTVPPPGQSSSSAAKERSRTPSPILGFTSAKAPTLRASDGHLHYHMPALGPSSEDIAILLGHDLTPSLPQASAASAHGRPAKETTAGAASNSDDSDVDGDGEWVEHLDLDPHISALMDKDDSPHPLPASIPAVAGPSTLPSRDAVLLRLQQLGLGPGQVDFAATTPVEQELSQTLYNLLEQVRVKDEEISSSRRELQSTRQHALSLITASIVSHTHQQLQADVRSECLEAERDGLHSQCRLLSNRLAEAERSHRRAKVELEERLARRERKELAAYVLLEHKVPGIERILEKYLLPRSALLNRYGGLPLDDSDEALDGILAPSREILEALAAITAPDPATASSAVAIDSVPDADPAQPVAVSEQKASTGDDVAANVPPDTAPVPAATAERDASEGRQETTAPANMPISAIVAGRLQMSKDYRLLKVKARDQSTQITRLSDEIRSLRPLLIGQGVPHSDAVHTRNFNKADEKALEEEKGKGRGSDPTAHFVQRQQLQRERRRKRAAMMGDAAAEHLILAADRIARLRSEREHQERIERIQAEKTREEQRLKAREQLHDRYLDNPTYKMYPYPGEARGSKKNRKGRADSAVRSGGPRRKGRAKVSPAATRRSDARQETPPLNDSAVYFGSHPPRTPGRESHARGKGPVVDNPLTTPGGSAMSELLQAANSLLSPSKQAQQAREAQARQAADADHDSSLAFSDDSLPGARGDTAQPFYPNGTPMRTRPAPTPIESAEASARRKRRRVDRDGTSIPATPQNGTGKGSAVMPFSPLDLLADQAAATSHKAVPGQNSASRAQSVGQAEDSGLSAYNPPGASGFRRFGHNVPAPPARATASSARPPAGAPTGYAPAPSSASPAFAQSSSQVRQRRTSEGLRYSRSESARSPIMEEEEDEDEEMDDEEGGSYYGGGYEEGQYDEEDDGEDDADDDDLEGEGEDGEGEEGQEEIGEDGTPYYMTRPREGADRRVPYTRWTIDEDRKLMSAIADYGQKWKLIARRVKTRTYHQCRQRFLLMRRKEAAAAGRTLGGRDLPPPKPRKRPGRPRRGTEKTHGEEEEGEDDEEEEEDDDEEQEEAAPAQTFTAAMEAHIARAGANAGADAGSSRKIKGPTGSLKKRPNEAPVAAASGADADGAMASNGEAQASQPSASSMLRRSSAAHPPTAGAAANGSEALPSAAAPASQTVNAPEGDGN